MKQRKKILQIIKTTNDIDLLEHISNKLPHLKELIYERILIIGANPQSK